MRSQLARYVYRRIRLCPVEVRRLQLAALSYSTLPRHHVRTAPPFSRYLIAPRQSRRTFFGIFEKPPRELKEPELEPGYATLLEFNSNSSDGLRLPPRADLVQAFRDLFEHKLRRQRVVNSTQARCALPVLRYLADAEQDGENLSLRDLRSALEALLRPPKAGSVEKHLELSKAIYLEIKRRVTDSPEVVEGYNPLAGEAGSEDFKAYLTALTQYGAAVEAAGQLETYWTRLLEDGQLYRGAKALWVFVLRGLAKEDREEELLRQLKWSEDAGVEYAPAMHEVMTSFYAQKDDFNSAKTWFERPIYGNWLPSPDAYSAVLRLAVRVKRLDWAAEVFERLCNTNPHKQLWDVILQWAVLAQGKGEEEVKAMMETMIRLNADKHFVRPDTTTINALIQVAIEKDEPLLAERFVSLARELGLQPNSVTFILQMEYRLAGKDLSGATAAYRGLEDSGVMDDQALDAINKYARALCAVNEPDTARILQVIGAVERKQAFLEPDTVAAICIMFLKADQQFEVIDTLSLHTLHYSFEEREIVQKAFVEYCADRTNSTARAWDAYSLLRQFFPDTERPDRARLMQAFFDRKRSDMAAYVFGHMRAHDNPAMRPTADDYATCLAGLGRYPDEESLRIVHNMLKMDTTITMTTKIYNGLMMAYAASEEPQKAADFWKDITQSAEGPTYNSLNIIFRVCESLPFGETRARMVWEKLKRMDVDIPPFVFGSYCGALARHGNAEEVMGLIKGQNAQTGHRPGWVTLGIVYNALAGQEQRADFEAWAKAEYPELWEKLRKKRRRKTAEGLETFEFVREMWV